MVSKTFSRSSATSSTIRPASPSSVSPLPPPLIRHSVRRFRDMPLDRPAWDDPRTYTGERPIGSNQIAIPYNFSNSARRQFCAQPRNLTTPTSLAHRRSKPKDDLVSEPRLVSRSRINLCKPPYVDDAESYGSDTALLIKTEKGNETYAGRRRRGVAAWFGFLRRKQTRHAAPTPSCWPRSMSS